MTSFEAELIGTYFVGLGAGAVAWGVTRLRLLRTASRGRRAGAGEVAYRTPPDISRCRNLRLFGPTPCVFPNCECFDEARA